MQDVEGMFCANDGIRKSPGNSPSSVTRDGWRSGRGPSTGSSAREIPNASSLYHSASGAKFTAIPTSYHGPLRNRAPSRFQDQRTDEAHRQSARPHQPTKRRESCLCMSVPRRTGPQHVMGDTVVVVCPPEGVAQRNLGGSVCGLF